MVGSFGKYQNFNDTVQFLTIGRVIVRGVTVIVKTVKGYESTGFEGEERLLKQRDCNDANRLAGGLGGLRSIGERSE